MKWNDVKEYFNSILVRVLITMFVIFLTLGFLHTCKKDNVTVTPPVEKNEIDSIIKVNDRLIIKVDSLDSIKNAKVIEVKNLNNDSTLKLFYELIRE